MKLNYIFILTILFLSIGSLNAQNLKDPVEYNNYILKEQNEIIRKSIAYMSWSVHSEDYNLIEKERQQLLTDIRYSIKKIGRMPAFEGSNRLKRETIDVFKQYVHIYETDLLDAIGKRKKFNDTYTALEAYMKAEKKMDDKMNRALEQLSRAQSSFAKRNDIKFETDRRDQLAYDSDQINLLSNYSRRVFLEYFYVSWKFNDMVSVLQYKEPRLLDRKRKAMLKAASEAIENLSTMDRYKKETDYIGQTIDIIEYFQTLGKKEFVRIVAIYKKDTILQADADFINRVFSDYNANIEVLVYNWNLANKFLWTDNIR